MPKRRDVVGASAVYAVLLSTWTVAGLLTLAIAWLADQSIDAGTRAMRSGTLGAADGPFFHPAPGGVLQATFIYGARFGLAPVAAAVAACAALWLFRRQRREAASAAATVAVVVIAFNARQFTTIDFIGWRAAAAEMLVAGRTIATTAIAFVLAFVFDREQFVTHGTAASLGVGFPLAIGLSRISLGVHGAFEIAVQWAIGTLIAAGIAWAYVLTARSTRQPPS